MKNLFLALSLSALLFSCQSTGLKIGGFDVGKVVSSSVNLWDANNIDQEDEIQFGQNMSAVLLGTRPLHESKALNLYVNRVGMWLAYNSIQPDLPWRFGVINSDSINAFAAPGGFVFITSGMLKQLTNEAQLAAILAHEIIHVTQQHHLQAIKDGALRGAVTESLFVAAESYQSNTGAGSKDRQYSEWAKKITGAAQDLYSKGLDRDDEFQADKLGIRLLAKAGYDAYAFIDNLQVLDAISADDTSLALMYKTHPTPTQRLQAIASQLSYFEETNGLLLTKRFKKNVY